jgi:hypothetical protein
MYNVVFSFPYVCVDKSFVCTNESWFKEVGKLVLVTTELARYSQYWGRLYSILYNREELGWRNLLRVDVRSEEML